NRLRPRRGFLVLLRRRSEIAGLQWLQCSCRREESVVKSRLKRAETRLANTKSRTDVRLGGAKKFDVDLTGFVERATHGFKRERGRVAIAAEVTKHHALDFSGKQFFDHGRGGVVGKVSMPRLDPLFHR